MLERRAEEEDGASAATEGQDVGKRAAPDAAPAAVRPPLARESLWHPQTAAATVAFAACNSVMLVINKVTIHLLPVPSLVLACQLAASGLFVVAASRAGLVECEPFERDKVKTFLPVVLAFLAALFCNAKVRPCCRSARCSRPRAALTLGAGP